MAVAAALAGGLLPLHHAFAHHMPIDGVEESPIALSQALATPSQVLALLGLGMMLGLRWPQWFKVAWLAFAVSTFLGICLGQLGVRLDWEVSVLLLIAILAATLSALRPAGFYVLFVLLSSLGGLLIGLLSTPDPAPLRATIISLSGSFVGANLTLVCVSGGVGWFRERFTHRWVGIGLRVVAAWIATISVLMASLTLVAQ